MVQLAPNRKAAVISNGGEPDNLLDMDRYLTEDLADQADEKRSGTISGTTSEPALRRLGIAIEKQEQRERME